MAILDKFLGLLVLGLVVNNSDSLKLIKILPWWISALMILSFWFIFKQIVLYAFLLVISFKETKPHIGAGALCFFFVGRRKARHNESIQYRRGDGG